MKNGDLPEILDAVALADCAQRSLYGIDQVRFLILIF
jgi:hypothetical protein